MVPIALLGSAVYLGLQLAQSQLSHEQYLDEATTRVNELEAQVNALEQ
jgi:outer membrane murein-binding lipoprotein Lpp